MKLLYSPRKTQIGMRYIFLFALKILSKSGFSIQKMPKTIHLGYLYPPLKLNSRLSNRFRYAFC